MYFAVPLSPNAAIGKYLLSITLVRSPALRERPTFAPCYFGT